jgi:hypothetical protein
MVDLGIYDAFGMRLMNYLQFSTESVLKIAVGLLLCLLLSPVGV